MAHSNPRTCLGLFFCSAFFYLSSLDLQAEIPSVESANIPLQMSEPTNLPDTVPANSRIRADTTLVQINVSVTDPLDRFVTGMDKEHFQLFEDRVEQTILHVSNEDAPLSIGLVFDVSGSMGAKLQKSRQAVSELVKGANPEDEFFLIEFSDRPDFVVPFTRNVDEIQDHLAIARSKGSTALLDAVYLAMKRMKKAHNPRKAIVIISDGGDNNSRYNERDVRNAVREADVQIYGLGIFEPAESRDRSFEELMGPSLLSDVANLTGGRAYTIGNLNDLPDAAAKIGIELRNQYVLYYSPKNEARDGKFRHVRVKVNRPRGCPPLKTAFRLGYFAPAQ